MNFSTDRDLLMLEPHVFRDVPMMSQQRVKVTDAAVASTTLSSNSADFVAAQVDTGSVALIVDGNIPCEVVSRTNANTLEISLPREDPNTAPIPPVVETDNAPAPGAEESAGLTVVVRTFAGQAAVVHGLLLRLAGIDDDDPQQPLTADAILSRSIMAHLEALGTLELVYAAGATLVGDDEEMRAKSERFRQRFNKAVRESSVLLDVDGDGHPDVRRRFGIVHMTRD